MYGLSASALDVNNQRYRIRDIDNEEIMSTFGNIGHSLSTAVERFITIGEIIAEENSDIKADMYEAAKEARDAGKSIEHLCDLSPLSGMELRHHIEPLKDYGAIVLAARSLLSSITRILLLVDIIVVKKLLTAKKRASESLEKLESVMNFTEFVRAFSIFGTEMIELAYLTGHHRNSFKEERRRAQMFSARQILEKSISILLTSSKSSLIHSDCVIVKENRDTVFCQIRRAMDLIHFVIKDSIFDSAKHMAFRNARCNSNYENESIYTTIKRIVNLIKRYKLQTSQYDCNSNNEGNNDSDPAFYSLFNDEHWQSDIYHKDKNLAPLIKNTNAKKNLTYESLDLRDELSMAFDKLFEKAHDFTDSPYISHEHRKNILTYCDNCKLEFDMYLNHLIKDQHDNMGARVQVQGRQEPEMSMLSSLEELCKQLVISVSSQIPDFNESLKLCTKIVKSFHMLAVTHDLENLNQCSTKFHDCCDHIFDICKLLQHIAPTERLQVHAKCLAINLRIYGPQVFIAAKILWKYTNSSAANENFESFLDMWKWLINEISMISKKILVTVDTSKTELDSQIEKCETTIKSAKPYVPATEEGEMVEYSGLDSKTNGDPGTFQSKWADDVSDDNDILKRAKNMSAMAFLMYQFTKGSGSLRTTQDLFTQAEYFAEEANRLYKVLRHFSYQVPASDNKKDLLGILDRVPTFVQALQFTVKDHTVGKAATFVKVDHVIRETKNLMNVINKVVSKCFECANKYKLNLTGITGGLTSGSVRGDDNVSGGMGDSKGTTSSSEGSM
ncbi:alpha-catulin [Drosophila sulfurigaster albostrigata]|uniref:alpha-catulin n=1 Tax=Drosophila sulfurigaster albostrigata TaxID=89887 RepID=UPI002D21AF24|nr:alpha-catulin [Drosophila sulfurigaster albostrigata]XP_062128924.1 alpha-catulin [Drosophila sulfurigaster albostrigata]